MAALGHPPMPWQSQVNAVANEVLEDGTFRYKVIICSVPRQAGKTTLLGAVMAHRAMVMRDHRSWYSAQTGQAARDTWSEWHRQLSAAMPGRWKFRLSNGEETARWEATGGFIRAFPPVPESLHGKQGDLIALDEVWDYSLEQGEAIVQATIPTQATRPMRQTWIVSTAGTANSHWMRSWIERGRAAVDDPDSTIAHFEWSIPDGEDVTDPDTWARHHPAFSLTQTPESFHNALEQLGPEGFARAYGNQWPRAATSWRHSWASLGSPDGIPARAPVFLAVDAPPHLRSACIVAAGRRDDDRVALEVIQYAPNVDWLLDRLVQLHKRHRAPVAIARTGPLGYLLEELQRAGVRTVPVSQTEYADAVARFQTMTVAKEIAHQDDDLLNAAVVAVQDTNTERPTWRRKDTNIDISPLVAASMAAWQAAVPPVKPVVRA